MSTRKIKSPISRYSGRDDDGRPDTSRAVSRLDVIVLVPEIDERQPPTTSRDDRQAVPPNAADIGSSPCSTRTSPDYGDIATHFGDITTETMYRQLNR